MQNMVLECAPLQGLALDLGIGFFDQESALIVDGPQRRFARPEPSLRRIGGREFESQSIAADVKSLRQPPLAVGAEKDCAQYIAVAVLVR